MGSTDIFRCLCPMSAGVLVPTEGLAFPDQAKRVRAASDGTPITDGVFPESMNMLRAM